MIQPYETTYMGGRRVSPRIHAVPAPKTSILRFVDAVDTPVAITNREGSVTAMNGAAREFFVGRAGTQLRGMVEGAARRAMGERGGNNVGSPNRSRQFEIGHERYNVTIVVAGSDVVGQDIGAMLMLRREAIANPPQLSEHALVRRFQLTPQEARVALMLADQRSNKDVAAGLGVSIHTARHHTERVLAKLEVHSRYDVRKAISRDEDPGDALFRP